MLSCGPVLPQTLDLFSKLGVNIIKIEQQILFIRGLQDLDRSRKLRLVVCGCRVVTYEIYIYNIMYDSYERILYDSYAYIITLASMHSATSSYPYILLEYDRSRQTCRISSLASNMHDVFFFKVEVVTY